MNQGWRPGLCRAAITDKTDLTTEQQASLAYAITILRSEPNGLKGWSQYRYPPTGTPQTIRLIRRSKGRIQQTWDLYCQDAQQLPL